MSMFLAQENARKTLEAGVTCALKPRFIGRCESGQGIGSGTLLEIRNHPNMIHTV